MGKKRENGCEPILRPGCLSCGAKRARLQEGTVNMSEMMCQGIHVPAHRRKVQMAVCAVCGQMLWCVSQEVKRQPAKASERP